MLEINFHHYSFKTTNVRLRTSIFDWVVRVADKEKVTFGEACEALLEASLKEYGEVIENSKVSLPTKQKVIKKDLHYVETPKESPAEQEPQEKIVTNPNPKAILLRKILCSECGKEVGRSTTGMCNECAQKERRSREIRRVSSKRVVSDTSLKQSLASTFCQGCGKKVLNPIDLVSTETVAGVLKYCSDCYRDGTRPTFLGTI